MTTRQLLHRSGAMALVALALLACALAPQPLRAQADEEPAAEAPPARPAKPAPAEPAEEEEAPAAPAPKVRAPKADASAPAGPLTLKVEKQGKELAALKKENDELKKQVRLLYLIVNKLAGLNQAQ